MSRIGFLADQNFNEDILTGLLRLDPMIQVVRARQIQLQEAIDPDVLAYAADEDLLVISHDFKTMPAHAYSLMRQGLPMRGLLLIKQTDPIGPPIDSLFLIWSASEAEEWINRVIYLPL